jgi:hypothetical protein
MSGGVENCGVISVDGPPAKPGANGGGSAATGANEVVVAKTMAMATGAAARMVSDNNIVA